MKPSYIMLGKYQHGKATCVLNRSVQVPSEMRNGIREISSLQTPAESRRNGDATQLLHSICEEADTQRIVLLLHAEPFGDSALDADQLESWYAKFGFMVIQAEPKLMARMVDSTPRVLACNPVTLAVAHAIEAM